MEATAFFLDLCHGHDEPVVVTVAMRNPARRTSPSLRQPVLARCRRTMAYAPRRRSRTRRRTTRSRRSRAQAENEARIRAMYDDG
ncbi:hypothetical protein [Streptomyces sp. NPDC050982]|uniref:hypothetical protein n=1 Tax=Streptomyces sp. NPDC050982 TaxID=3154746 RepID=UPI0033FFFCAE